jgi:squalene-hopene/tetraprenyl-beta-curcumene cyclase
MPFPVHRFIRCIALVFLVSLTLPCPTVHADASPKSAQQAIEKGLSYLRSAQKKDGSWSEYPAMTALSVSAFLLNGRTEQNEPAVARGVKFILGFTKPTGEICINGNPATAMPNYNTSLCVIALLQTKNPAYKTVIQKAQKYLETSQFAEGKGINPANPMYGGIGYGDDPGDETHPDLSNLQHALEALHACGVPSTAPVFKKALIYLQRVQNRRESNDQAWAKEGPKDGGFLYESQGGTKTATGKHASYGATTYAGLKCYNYCGVAKNDPRVQVAWNWIRAHYSVTEHPAMGNTSLYYYYRTMAMTLDAYGQKVIQDKSGKQHYWANELARQIVSLQHSNGSWASTNSRYWENQPDLVTGYSLIALAYCLKNGAATTARTRSEHGERLLVSAAR